jgi:hypothetical protein
MDIISMINSVSDALKGVFSFIDDLHLGKEEKLEFHNKIANIVLELEKLNTEVIKQQSSVIVAEAQSGSWITRSWRPILMCVFGGIIVYDLVIVPLAGLPVVGDTKVVPAEIWNLLKIGIGGYIGGRSLEKIADKISLSKVLKK